MKLFFKVSSIALIVSASVLLCFAVETDKQTNNLIGKKLPSFNLKSTTRENVLLGSFKNKKLIIFMFSTKCPYSASNAKYLQKILKKQTAFQLIAICLDGEVGDINNSGKTQELAAKNFEKKYFPDNPKVKVLLANDDFRRNYARFLKLDTMRTAPITLFADAKSIIVEAFVGSASSEQLEQAAKKLTSEK